MTAIKIASVAAFGERALEELMSAAGARFVNRATASIVLNRHFVDLLEQARPASPWSDGEAPTMPADHDGLARDLALYLSRVQDLITWQGVRLNSLRYLELQRRRTWSLEWGIVADVVAIWRPAGFETAPATSIYEIKVGRGDLMKELRSAKWRGYAELATKFFFATPADLVAAQELPAGVGLIERRPGGWRVRRGAKARGPLADWLLLSTLIRHDYWTRRRGRAAADGFSQHMTRGDK